MENKNLVGLNIVPEESRQKVEDLVSKGVKGLSYVPSPIALRNASSSGLRNVYVELDIQSTSLDTEITDTPDFGTRLRGYTFSNALFFSDHFLDFPSGTADVNAKLARFSSDKLQRVDGGWRLSVEWEAIQPQRTRLVKPVLYAHCRESFKIVIAARVFGDSFPEPFTLEASATVNVKQGDMQLRDLVPGSESWRRRSSAGAAQQQALGATVELRCSHSRNVAPSAECTSACKSKGTDMLGILAVLISVVSIVWAFFSPVWAWTPLFVLALGSCVMLFGLKQQKWKYVPELSSAANDMLQRYGHYYLMPGGGRDFSSASSAIQLAGIVIGIIGAFKGFYWGLAISAGLYAIMGPIAMAFNPTNFIRNSEFQAPHEEVIAWLASRHNR